MTRLMVNDLNAWWEQALELPGRFGVPVPKPVTMQPWGLRTAYVFDPSEVLWHAAERREGQIFD
jgi:uncharacterized glyoxalase superfamily protein PhnB